MGNYAATASIELPAAGETGIVARTLCQLATDIFRQGLPSLPAQVFAFSLADFVAIFCGVAAEPGHLCGRLGAFFLLHFVL